VTPEAIAAVEAIVKENHHVMVNEIATHLDMNHGSAHHIVHDVSMMFCSVVFNKLGDKTIYGFHLTHPHI